ncbi:MAG: enoyl-CoA hydratase/isomerase family protein [Pyrinomonadaceae bacterium]
MNSSKVVSPIVTRISESIAVVTFTDFASRNSLSTPTLDRLEVQLSEMHADKRLRVIIFTGVDKVFLAGADIRELKNLNCEAALAFAVKGQSILQRIADSTQLTIAAINGYCFGGGLDFALACKLRLASSNAVFAHPGAQLGIITGWGGTQRLASLIGRTRSLEIFVTARRLSAAEALTCRLVSDVVDPVEEAAQLIARRFVARSYPKNAQFPSDSPQLSVR